ncbi:MAG: GNAT family N-acetyltransferase [Perlabentimonas sp.]
MKLVIREIKQSELPFLKVMLYQAIYVPEGSPPLPMSIVEHPNLTKYIENFGRDGDICLVAEVEGKLVGAAWSRLFTEQNKGYGFIDSQTPEISMAVLEPYRNMGIGKKLLNELLNKMTQLNFSRASLSVDKSNHAYKLYKKIGFETILSTSTSVTMLKSLKQFVLIAILFILAGCNSYFNGELHFIEPKSSDSFNFPYYLYIPSDVAKDQKAFVVVEPNNSGFVDDNLLKHIEKAERIATKDFYIGNYVANELNYPLIIPIFPRSRTNWEIYTHALDRDAMIQKNNNLERIDLQLIAMFNDARTKLKSKDIETNDRMLLVGFSASASFANRFTLLHPNRVFSLAAGGLNGLLMLPSGTVNGQTLNFPLGTNDFEMVTGNKFQIDLFKKVPQFYFMGELDENDAIPYRDAYSPNESETIYSLIGSEEMLPKRWDFCKKTYQDVGVNAKIKTYKKIGHEQPLQVKKDVVNFFRKGNITSGAQLILLECI